MTTGPSQSLNLGSNPSPYSDSFISLDLMKGLEAWHYFPNGEFSFIPPASLSKDAKGWLTELPVVNGVEQPVFTNVVYTQQLKPGKYILEWDGAGEIGVYQNATQIGPNKLQIDYDPTYRDANGQPVDDGFTVIIEQTDPNGTGNYIRNIKLYSAEDADLLAAGERFDPVWQDRIDDFRILRTHGWQNTNFPTAEECTRNVVSADQAGWGYDGLGMPFELIVSTANETRSDLWLTIPHTATDAYMRAAAEYVRENLDPDLRVHVEYSNEYWTKGFDQNQYFIDGGQAEFGAAPFAAGQFYGTRAARMADIFTAEFGANSKQLMPVLTVDDVFFRTGEAEALLTAPAAVAQGGVQPVSRGFDVIATDGYLFWSATDPFFSDQIDDWMTDADGGFGRARDFLLDQLKNDLLPNWQAGRALADKYGLDFMVYEGGALLLNGDKPGEGDPKYTEFALEFSKSAEMKEVYEATLAAWKTVGTGPFSWFADVGRPGFYGDYGHWKGPDFVPDPRTDAITRASEGTAAWWAGDDRPASTFDNGIYKAGTAGSELMLGGALDDRLYGLGGADTLDGREGDDKLWSGIGNDSLYGGAGDDELNGGVGRDRLFGGGGRDLADYRDSTAAVAVNLSTSTAAGGNAAGDLLRSIEYLRGSKLADRLTGNDQDNRLFGGEGADVLVGGKGADVLMGELGADTLTGGAGNDEFVFRSAADGADRITDFSSNATGNNDLIRVLGQGFGNHADGALLATEFQSSNSGVAANSAVRFIYDRDDARLYYDADGSGAGAAVLLATMQSGAIVTVGDFLFY
jgi:Ca2+-binding RTX toxin-like protein